MKRKSKLYIVGLLILIMTLVCACGDKADQNSSEGSETSESSKSNFVIVDDDNIYLVISDLSYTQDASPIEIEFDLDNKSKSMVNIFLDKISVDGVEIPSKKDDNPIEVGNYSVWKRVDREALQNAGVSDFQEVEFDVVVDVGDEEYTRKHIQLKRNDFHEDENDEATHDSGESLFSVVDDDKVYLAITDLSYTQDASPIEIEFDLDNRSKNLVSVYLDSVSVDGRALAVKPDDDPIEVGNYSVWRRIDREILQNANVSDFQEVEFDVVVKTGDEEHTRKHIELKRSDFHEE